MTSPYSLSRPGGVQGQVLGLARELRKLGVDVRVVGPCDGPPPEPGVVVGRAERRVELQRLGRADLAGARDRAAHGRGDAQHRARRRAPARAGGAGPVPERAHRVQRADGRHVPRVGRAARTCGRGPRCARRWQRLSVRVVVSESALETARANWYDAEYVVLWNGIEVERFASAEPDARAAAGRVLRRPARTAQGTRRCCSTRGAALDRDAVLWVGGAGPQTDELRPPRPVRRTSNGSARSPTPSATRGCAARRCSARRRCTASRSAWCCSRGWRRARRWSRPTIEGYRNVARADIDALLVPPGDVDALRDALRRVFDDPALRDRLVVRRPRARPSEFSMARLAERYLELYDTGRSVRTRPRMASRSATIDAAARVDLAARGPRRGCARRSAIRGAREGVGVAPGGDVTMAIDEIAEHVTEECCRGSRRHRVLLRRPRLRRDRHAHGRSSSSTRSTAPGPRPPASSRAASRSRCCRRRATRRSATSSFGVVHEIKSGHRFFATRGEGAASSSPTVRGPIALSPNADLARAVLDAPGVRGRPAVADGGRCSRSSIDDSSMHGGYFDLGSATFDMTRIVTGQLDAYVDLGRCAARRSCPALEPAFRRAGEGADLHATSPTTSRPRR